MRNRALVLVILMALPFLAAAQNLLDFEWKFNTGDDVAWADPAFDDGAWDKLKAGLEWENQGYGTYDGFAWYRQKVVIPSSLKGAAEENGGFILHLGQIDDSDMTYWNGAFLGQTGGMPPDYETGYSKVRAYRIPAARILWDQENTIAVRVFDGGGGGGIFAEPLSLSVIGLSEQVRIEPLMPREDHLFLEEGPVSFDLLVENKLDRKLEGNMSLEIRSDFGRDLESMSFKVRVKALDTKNIQVDLGVLEAGFYDLSATLKSESDNKRRQFSLGVRPESIDSPLDRPDDFADYWMRAKRELAAVEPQFELIRLEEYCSENREVFLLEMRSLGNVLVRGYYMRPAKAGVYPALLHVQGYSSVKIPEYLYPGDDMVSLALNIRGHGNSTDHVNPGFPGYILSHIDDPETYIYRGAYMDCVRAVDFLFSREEVDKSRVAVEGGSQGGALSFATAALNRDRIALCVPHVPFLSDFRDYFAMAGWPGGEVYNWLEAHPEVSEDQVYHTLSYIDIKNLAPWIKAPVFMAIGLRDRTCPPHINFAAYNQLDVEKSYYVFPEAGHGLPGLYHGMMYDYIRQQFGLD